VPVNVTAAMEWLQQLYGRQEAGWVNLFSVEHNGGRRHVEWAPVDNLRALGPMIDILGMKGDLWFGVAPRYDRLEAGARGGISQCASIPALWLDIDIAGPAHRLPNLPLNKSVVVTLIERFPLAPTAVVHSGYGLQPWWRLKEPLPAAEAIPLLTRWHLTWERIATEAGCHIDNVSNIDRVMRLPGTFNFKLGRPVPVTFKARWQLDYGADEVEDLLEPLPTREEVQTRQSQARHLAGSRFNEVVKCGEILKSLSWTLVRTDRRTGDTHWRHPKAANEVSATVYGDDGHCAVWSETVAAATGIPLRKPMDPFGLYSWLYHGANHPGDTNAMFKAARKDLLERGFHDAGEPGKKPKIDKIKVGQVGMGKGMVTRAVSEVTPVHPEWLWHRWLPKGKLVVLEGDPATGKSTVSLDLLARVTTGKEMPDGSPGLAPRNVLFLSAEDDMDDTTVWRLQAAGANLDRVIHVEAVSHEDEVVPVTLPLDTALLWEKVEEHSAALVVVDVLSAYLAGEVDTHKDAHVRRALQPLVEMARATGCTIILIRHLRKERTGKAMYQGNGSIGIAGVARAVHSIGYHPNDESIRVMAPVKVNTEAKPTALSFRLTKHETMPCAFVEWGGEVEFSADELLNITPVDPDSLQGQARLAIRELLPEGKEMPSHEFLTALQDLGFPRGIIDRARARENIKARQYTLNDVGANGVQKGWLVSRPANGQPGQF